MTEENIDREARADLRGHMDICTERYGNLWDSLKEIKAAMLSNNEVTHARFNAISNRMWAAVWAIAGAALLACGAMAFHLLTRSHP